MVRMTPRSQGDLGEFSAIEWLGMHGYDVCAPLGHTRDADLVADDGTELIRVRVKTTTLHRNRRWGVTLCTRGGNRSWNGLVKRFSASRCDRLFVLVTDGRRWFIPAAAVGGGTGIMLGGSKYPEFDVEKGRPLPSCAAR
jgi:PD-(D/E)XK endonuclease